MKPGTTTWQAGSYTLNLDVTTANSHLTVTGGILAQRSSAGSLIANLATATLSQSLSATGVFALTITLASDTAVSSTDILQWSVEVSNSAMNTQSFSFTPDKTVDTPITSGPQTFNDTLTETGAAADSLGAANTLSATVSEAGSGTDSMSGGLLLTGAVTESGAAADSLSQSVTFGPTLTESGSATGSNSVVGTFVPTVTESGTAADSLAPANTLSTALSESGTSADSLSAANTVTETLTESGTSSDSLSAANTLSATIVEAGAAADSVAGTIGAQTFNDTLTESGSATDSYDSTLVSGSQSVGMRITRKLRKKDHVKFRGKEYDAHRDVRKLAHDVVAWLEEKPAQGKLKAKVAKGKVTLPIVPLSKAEIVQFEDVARALSMTRELVETYLEHVRSLQLNDMEDEEDAITALLLAA